MAAMAVLVPSAETAKWQLLSSLDNHRICLRKACSRRSTSSNILTRFTPKHARFQPIRSGFAKVVVVARASRKAPSLPQNVPSHVDGSNSLYSNILSSQNALLAIPSSATVDSRETTGSPLCESVANLMRQSANVAASVLFTAASVVTLLSFPLDASAAAEAPADLAAISSSASLVSLSPGAMTWDSQQTLALSYSGPLARIADITAAVETAPNTAFPAGQSAIDNMAAAGPVIDGAQLLGGGKREAMIRQLESLEREYGWRMRVLTRYAPEQFETEALRAVWQPDDRTVVVVADVTSPNILNFFAGDTVREKLPRQFFIELQSRFGNQFYVAEQGDTRAVQDAVATLQTCLLKPSGCNNVPGLVDDLYFITLSTAILSGIVFGFAARLEPSGKVEASWQWVLLFSPLWLLLLVAFSFLPITARTDDLEPLLKNGAGFLAGAAAIYLTPIFGQSPVANWGKGKEDGTRSGTQSGRDSDSDGF